MKKLLILLTLLLISCSQKDCLCTGKFVPENGSQFPFYIENVNCETGNPYLKERNETGNPVTYLGCKD